MSTPPHAPLGDAEKPFRLLVELLVEGTTEFAMFLVDPDGRVASWNAGARRILGYEVAEVLGQPATLIFTPEDRANGVPERELAAATRDGRAADVRWHQRKDGSRFWASGLTMALRGGGDGQAPPPPPGLLVVMRPTSSRVTMA